MTVGITYEQSKRKKKKKGRKKEGRNEGKEGRIKKFLKKGKKMAISEGSRATL